jgi:hypothetical protein
MRKYNWSEKALRRRTTGTGRMQYLKHVPEKQPGLIKVTEKRERVIAKLVAKGLKKY